MQQIAEPTPPHYVTAHLRGAAAARVESTSLRAAAREIGMSPTGLRKFLDGTTPYATTLRRLRRWYLHHATAPAPALTRTDAAVALAVLSHGVPPDARRELVHAVLDALERAYDSAGLPRPAWIGELRREHGGERPSRSAVEEV